jgi:predicted transcriptional regulator
VSEHTAHNPVESLTVERFARRGIVTCAPDADLREVAWAMANNHVHAVFVADDRGLAPPVVLDSDLVAAAISGRFDQLCAADIASAEAPSVFLDDQLRGAVRLMSERGVAHLVVRDEHRTPVGVLSTLDVARALADSQFDEGSR